MQQIDCYVRLHDLFVYLFIQRFSQHVSVVCDHHRPDEVYKENCEDGHTTYLYFNTQYDA
jgi:hypothetical protein